MNSNVRNAFLWVVVLLLLVVVWVAFKTNKAPGAQPSFSELVNQLKEGKVE